ncbi:MAG TPA: homoserine O-succinyltransferase [Xanthobacteraceae bacterium]
MPVLIDKGSLGCTILAGKEPAAARVEARRHPAGSEWIEIGLVNNMPEAVLEPTEQQFLALLGAASGDSWVRLRFFSLPGVPPSERGQRYLRQSYGGAADIREAGLDGLIVTGTEPKAARLPDEPYWPAFTTLVDWARHNTISTIWSCLAAHAAVLHLDGIERVPLREKCIGVFACDKLADHPLTQSLPPRSAIPHARWNALSEAALAESGYQVLTRSPAAGVDAFVRQEQSLLLFFQGHPEYGALALLSEYRRDVARFLTGERKGYPAMPQHYFDAPTEAALTAFRQRAEREPHEDLWVDFPVAAEAQASANALSHTNWQPFAVTFYRNWLTHLSAQKQRLLRPTQYLASLRLDQAPAPAI